MFMKRFFIIVVFLIFCIFSINALDLSPPMATYNITSEVGVRKNPMGGEEESFHKGVDLVGPHNSYILAAADGIIYEHYVPPGGKWKGHPIYGGFIVIDHGNGIFTLYGHMSKTFIRTGDHVKRGQVIGIQGNTGVSTGEHLHFEVIIDPITMIKRNDIKFIK
jgi:murein DD-endopeptidase MepM/ murein hydrolase activator NlpD